MRLILLLALTSLGWTQTLHVEKTGSVGRRIENRYFAADLAPDSGTLRALTYKEFGVTLLRNPANGLMHKGPSLQRAGASTYKDQGAWVPVQTFREEQKDGAYVHRREGYFPGYPEVKIEVEYRVPADAPYFVVSTVMAVEKPIRVVLLRNNEMTMNLFFTHLAWSGPDGKEHIVTFEERKPILEEDPIPADTPWLAFLNPEKGYGYGFVTLGYKATKSVNPDITIADGTAGPAGAINGRYWSRHIIFGQEIDLLPGDRFEELSAYVLFNSSEAQPLRDFFDWEKRIRLAAKVAQKN